MEVHNGTFTISYKLNAKSPLCFTSTSVNSKVLRIILLSEKMAFLGIKSLPLWVSIILVMTSLAEQSKGDFCSFTYFSSLISLIPCRPSVAPFSLIPPTVACCNAVRTLGQPCLCAIVNGPPISGVDRDLAMLLPAKCAANFDPCEIMK